jgi:hypothetical protein
MKGNIAKKIVSRINHEKLNFANTRWINHNPNRWIFDYEGFRIHRLDSTSAKRLAFIRDLIVMFILAATI